MLGEGPEKPIERIASMAEAIQKTVKQLECLSRVISNVSPTAGEEPEIEAADLGNAMGLFAIQLAAIHDGLDDILGNAEHLMKPTLHAVDA